MNLPVEIVELVINQFLIVSDSDRTSYHSALKTVCLISSYYLELSRRFKFNDLQMSANIVYFGVLRLRLKVQAHLLGPVTRRTKSNPLTFNLAQYVKKLTLFNNEDACDSFIRIIGNQTVYIESIMIDPASHNPLDLLSKLNLGRFPRLDRIKLSSISIGSFNQCAATVNQLNPNIKLELECLLDRSPPIEHHLHALRVTLCHVLPSSCFEHCLESLRKLDLYISDDNFNCDSFISSAINLQVLTISRYRFIRASLIATLRAACKLKDIRKVSISHYYLRGSVNFFFKDQIVIGIDVELRKAWNNPITGDFSVFVKDLVNESSYIASKDVIKEITGQESDVDIRCFVDGAYIRREAITRTLVNFYSCFK